MLELLEVSIDGVPVELEGLLLELAQRLLCYRGVVEGDCVAPLASCHRFAFIL